MYANRPQIQSIAHYPNLKQILAPEYADLPSAEIEVLMEGMYGPGAAEYYEDYLEGFFGSIGKAFSSAARDVGRFATKAAPAIATVGGGALQGALAGSALGIPGIIAGAAAGGVGAGLSKYGRKGVARGIGNALSGATGLAGQFSPAGRAGAAIGPAISGLAGGGRGVPGAALNALSGLLGGGRGSAAINILSGLSKGGGRSASMPNLGALTNLFGGTSATGQLLSLLQRPETMQAIAAMNLGSLGRRTIPVGATRTPVPTSAIARVVGELVEQSVAETAAFSDGAEGELRYMTDETGEFVGDPALPAERAARVWELLNEAQVERLANALNISEHGIEAYDNEDMAEGYSDGESEEYLFEAMDEYYSDDEFDEYLIEVLGEDFSDHSIEWAENEYYESEYYESEY